VINWHVDDKRGDCWMVFPPDSHRPIGVVDLEREAKELVREHARTRLAEAQAAFDRVMERE
jgi:hypothetical protein